MSLAKREAVLEIRIVSVDEEVWRIGRLAPMNAVVKRLELQPVAVTRVTVPAYNEITSGDSFVAAARLVQRATEHVALDRDGVARARRPVQSEPAAEPVPTIFCRLTVRMQRRV